MHLVTHVILRVLP